MEQTPSLEERFKLRLEYDRRGMRWFWPMMMSGIFGLSILANSAIFLAIDKVPSPYPNMPSPLPRFPDHVYWIQFAVGSALLLFAVVGFQRSGHWIRLRNEIEIRPGTDDDPETVARIRAMGYNIVPVRSRNVIFIDGWLWNKNRPRRKR
jgi:hypothetical protein